MSFLHQLKGPPPADTLVTMIDFQTLLDQCRSLLAARPGRRGLQSVCTLLRQSAPHYNWVGFYVADADGLWLDLGPYDGEPTEHTRIAFGRGICGQAAATGRTFVVDDVSKETNYLSCSIHVKSEIVLPVLAGGDGPSGKVLAELDIDSHTPGAFTPLDRQFLEQLCVLVAPVFQKEQRL